LADILAKKRERFLLNYANEYGRDGKCLVSVEKLIGILKTDDVKSVLSALKEKGYIDIIFTDRHGEPYVYITLTKNGADRLSAGKRKTRELLIKIALASVSALITFIVGKLLYLLFS